MDPTPGRAGPSRRDVRALQAAVAQLDPAEQALLMERARAARRKLQRRNAANAQAARVATRKRARASRKANRG
jgi:hypothetical protein